MIASTTLYPFNLKFGALARLVPGQTSADVSDALKTLGAVESALIDYDSDTGGTGVYLGDTLLLRFASELATVRQVVEDICESKQVLALEDKQASVSESSDSDSPKKQTNPFAIATDEDVNTVVNMRVDEARVTDIPASTACRITKPKPDPEIYEALVGQERLETENAILSRAIPQTKATFIRIGKRATHLTPPNGSALDGCFLFRAYGLCYRDDLNFGQVDLLLRTL